MAAERKIKKCTDCHKRQASARRRECGAKQKNMMTVKVEVVCDDCEIKHKK